MDQDPRVDEPGSRSVGARAVGWSSGAFHAAGVGAEAALRDSLMWGATAFELSFLSVTELERFDLSALPAWREQTAPLAFRSVHAPVKGIERWDAATSRRWLPKLREVCQGLAVHSLVFHGEQLADPAMPWFDGLPVSVENSDLRKVRGRSGGPEFTRLEAALRAGHRVTFDLEHAAEHDADLGYARGLWEGLHQVRDDAVDHFHLSGPTAIGLRHGLVAASPRCPAFRDFAAAHPAVPVILEGRLERDVRGFDDLVLREMALASSVCAPCSTDEEDCHGGNLDPGRN